MVGFVLWEKLGARHPLIPFHLLKNRTIIAGFIIAIVHPCASGIASYALFPFVPNFADNDVSQQLLLHFLFVSSSHLVCGIALTIILQCPSPPTNLSNRPLEFSVSTSSPVSSLALPPVFSFGQLSFLYILIEQRLISTLRKIHSIPQAAHLHRIRSRRPWTRSHDPIPIR